VPHVRLEKRWGWGWGDREHQNLEAIFMGKIWKHLEK